MKAQEVEVYDVRQIRSSMPWVSESHLFHVASSLGLDVRMVERTVPVRRGGSTSTATRQVRVFTRPEVEMIDVALHKSARVASARQAWLKAGARLTPLDEVARQVDEQPALPFQPEPEPEPAPLADVQVDERRRQIGPGTCRWCGFVPHVRGCSVAAIHTLIDGMLEQTTGGELARLREENAALRAKLDRLREALGGGS